MVFGLKPMRVASSFVLRRTFGSWLSKRCCFEAVSISLFFASFSASLGWTQARPSATPDTSPVLGAVQQPRLLYGNLLQTRQLATFRSLCSARNNSWFP
jgi:hypothetical protein